MLIQDIKHEPITLVNTLPEVRLIDKYLDYRPTNRHSYFVKADEHCNYTEIYRFDGFIPYLLKEILQVK
jgi:hypothetical protein